MNIIKQHTLNAAGITATDLDLDAVAPELFPSLFEAAGADVTMIGDCRLAVVDKCDEEAEKALAALCSLMDDTWQLHAKAGHIDFDVVRQQFGATKTGAVM
jgi:hypothetical protein